RLQADGVRALTLTGPPGVGKTRLALEVAHTLRFDFEDGVSFVELAPLGDPGLVPSAVAQALGVTERAAKTLAASVIAALQPRHMLLVLDNFEHVLEAASFVAELLAACPALKILITSRAPLGIRAEQQFPIAGLSLPAAQSSFDTIAAAPAIQLFVERAKAVQAAFVLTAENADAVASI